jgi:hypothetical protein
MFEVQVMGPDTYIRPTGSQWRTMKGSDGRDWIEVTRDEAIHLANALTKTDRFTLTVDDEDG